MWKSHCEDFGSARHLVNSFGECLIDSMKKGSKKGKQKSENTKRRNRFRVLIGFEKQKIGVSFRLSAIVLQAEVGSKNQGVG